MAGVTAHKRLSVSLGNVIAESLTESDRVTALGGVECSVSIEFVDLKPILWMSSSTAVSSSEEEELKPSGSSVVPGGGSLNGGVREIISTARTSLICAD